MMRLIALIADLLAGSSASARDHAPGAGAAIVPVFTAQHSAMRPGEEVTLVACVANGNPHVQHDIHLGDQFRMRFVEGTLLSCGEITVSPPDIEISPTDFTCAIADRSVVLRHRGADADWPTGAAICVTTSYVAPPRSSTIVPEVVPTRVGSYAPPVPPLVQLAVSNEIDSIGPLGPAGPAGPMGPAGPSGPPGPPGQDGAPAIGAAHHWVSTDWTGPLGLPDDVVPGLDQFVEVSEGSSLYLHVTTPFHRQCWPAGTFDWRSVAVVVELDGVEVMRSHSRTDGLESHFLSRVADQYLAVGLPAGLHRVRVRVPVDPGSGEPPLGVPYCVGHASDKRLQARLTAIELRQ